ncbi:uncharacterized protein LOC103580248 [Microplitis demolitor]|uniref:uncharacterized protein LOC103580248 n=1 Tax=Microplitis demolitor TaxID=69319 RepID=UPI00044003B6|nr:uncharacterized protein LOC103580248 [Microplitis demolitor]XP_008560158.1 uncharacterized protein LOC103580248 [Microplitis demolitor]XP_053592889.1 uncharacterized protein LOC103580248 [Microplitis demolitor]XP_053592890.1 uncharacterized protein LOC103580248 [Microplitis demolitor]
MNKEEFGYTRRDPQVLRRAYDHPKPESLEGVSGRSAGGSGVGGTLTETGSAQANVQHRPAQETSVIRDTSKPPNVVEFHFKVSPNSVTKQDREMRTEQLTPLSSRDKSLIGGLSNLSIDKNVFEGSEDLPQVFQVKYLGSHDARGLWGIKHTRKPVDNMVEMAKSLPTGTVLPLMKLIVSTEGVTLVPYGRKISEANNNNSARKLYPIETISYGVQDLVYTRVFSMIVVRDTCNFRKVSPFECHGFVCESKYHARQMTYALATAFQIYSHAIKNVKDGKVGPGSGNKKFAIDLRTPEEIETELTRDSEA